MSYHAMPTENLQKIVDFLYNNYKGRDDVHELIKLATSAKPVNLIEKVPEPTTEVSVESAVNTEQQSS